MSEQTVETPDETVETPDETTEQENVEETSKPSFDAESLDEFGKMLVAKTSSQIERLNAAKNERKTLSNDPKEIAEAIYDSLKSGTVPDGVTVAANSMENYNKAMAAVDKILTHFREVAETLGTKRAAESQDAEKITALDTEITDLTNKVRKAVALLSVENPGAETLLPDVVSVRGVSGTGDGRGKGQPKMRGFDVKVDGELATLPGTGDNAGKKVSSFAAAGVKLGIPTAELQRAYFTAINATEDDVKNKTYQDKIPAGDVTFTVKGKDDKDHSIVATKRGE